MATKKKTDPEERAPSANDEASGTDESTPKAEERPSKEGSPTDDSKRSDGEDSGGQLFFSTDGEESPPPKENPFREETSPAPTSEENVRKESDSTPKPSSHNKGGSKKPHPNQQGQGGGSNNREGKKQNWQDKKRQKNRSRQKFKKPRKLPYEETETRPLEIGDLLESEELKTEEGLIALAEEFAGSGQEPICLDELLSLSLQELKEKIVSLPLQMELGTAPLKEEIFDALLASCLEKTIDIFINIE